MLKKEKRKKPQKLLPNLLAFRLKRPYPSNIETLLVCLSVSNLLLKLPFIGKYDRDKAVLNVNEKKLITCYTLRIDDTVPELQPEDDSETFYSD